MISAILLAWAPTAAYAGDPNPDPVTITTESRKGIGDLDGPCDGTPNFYTINIRGKGDYKLGDDELTPLPKGTSTIRVTFDATNSDIVEIKFIKKNGFLAVPDIVNPGVSSILIDAKIANSVLCNKNIPKGTLSLTLTGVTAPG